MRSTLVLTLCLFATTAALAAEPTVRAVNVRGLQIAGTTTITIDGDDLGKAPKLLLPFPAKPTLKPGNTEKKAEYEVALDDSVMPGLYHLRIVTEGGVSLPILIGVDRLPQKPLAAKIETLPVAVHGTTTGSTIAETTFSGKANEKVTIEIEAQRLGSKLRPVIHLTTAKKLQLAWAWGTPALNGDARLEATLPADGAYTVSVHDAEYAGQNPGHFRLKVGTFGYVDRVYPPVVGKTAKQIELIGSAFVREELPSLTGPAVLLKWPKGTNWTGPRPWVEVSSRPEYEEIPTSASPQKPMSGSFAISGKLATPYEEDRHIVTVKPNAKLRLEVFADRIGSPLDAAVVVRNETGAVLAQAEDSPGTLDPVLDYTVPDKVTSITVGVQDASGRGGPLGIYRLVVDEVKAEGLGDFRLTTPVQRLSLSSGGRAIVPVYADRRGYAGKIDLTADALPPGVKLEGATIRPDADGVLVSATAGDLTGPSISGFAARGAAGPARPVVVKGHPLERLQPWLATEIAVAPTTAKAADFAVDWKNLPADAGLSPAGKLALPVTVKRPDPAAPVRITLLTSQSPVLVNNQPDPNRALRPERPVELAAKVSDGEVSLLVPPELAADSYQIAIQAEMLSPDKQKVLATAFTSIRELPVKRPVRIAAELPKLDVKRDAKAATTAELKGIVERLNGFAGDVTVTLTGLPAGVPVPAAVTVKAGETKYAFKLTIPPTTPPGEAKLKLSATVAPDAKAPNVRVKSRDADVVLNIK